MTEVVGYNHQAERWKRSEPDRLSEFVSSPVVLEIMKRIAPGKNVLDLGCGEGYMARQVLAACEGTIAHVTGVDISSEMIKLARKQIKPEDSMRVTYHVGDALDLLLPDNQFDVVLANSVANYFPPEELYFFYKNMARVMKKPNALEQPRFVVQIPHPRVALTQKGKEYVEFEGIEDYDYIESRGKVFNAKLKTVSGRTLEVSYVHSTLEDHFHAIEMNHLAVTRLVEPVVSAELGEKHPLFKDVVGTTPYLIMEGVKLK